LRRIPSPPLTILALAATALLACASGVRTASVALPPGPSNDLVIRDVAVIDVETGRRTPARDVWVRNGRIAAIEPTGSSRLEGARVIDGRGASLLPGLIDMHGHVSLGRGPLWALEPGDPEANLRSFLYAGVTTVFDPSDSTGDAVERRGEVARRERLGPTIYTAGKMLTCPGGHPVAMTRLFAPGWISWYIAPRMATQVESREEAYAAVDALAARGVDFIKVAVDRLPPQAPRISTATLKAIGDRARKRDMRWVAHIGTTQDAIDAAEAGASLWAHGVAQERIPEDRIQRLAAFGIPMVVTIEVADRYIRGLSGPIDPIPMERQTVPPDVLDSFYPPPDGFSLDAFGSLEGFDSPGTSADNMMRLRRAGVTILAGSDSQGGGIFPGASLHRELGQLVRAGLTPGEAIRAATLDSATFLADGQPIEFGAVRVGLKADLLLVEGDPTEDVARLQDIREVILGGTPIERRSVLAPETGS